MKLMHDAQTEWMGSIPNNWKTGRIGGLYSPRNIKVNDEDYPPLSVSKQGVVPQIETVAKSNDHGNRKLVKRGDFAINSRSDRRNSCGISEYEGSVSLINTVLEPQGNMISRYYNWLFHTNEFADEFYKWGHGIVDDLWTTGWEDMKKILIPIPPLEEQKTIADYLDSKCEEIDSLITELQDELDKLEAYKRTVIIESTTKGIDQSVKTRESGISYIGQIPSEWSVEPVYLYFSERKNINKLLLEQNLLSLSYGKIVQKDINTLGGLLPASFATYNIVEKDDIIIRPTDLQNDKKSLRTGLCKERGIITSAYIALQPKKEMDVRFFHYQLHAFDVMKVFYNMGNGVRQGLNYGEFSKLSLLVPTTKEQRIISDYLDSLCSEIDSIKIIRERQLEILLKYKKTVLFECVTGKRGTIDE